MLKLREDGSSLPAGGGPHSDQGQPIEDGGPVLTRCGGVDVTLYIGAGMQHIFPIYCGVIPEAEATVVMIGTFIRSRTS